MSNAWALNVSQAQHSVEWTALAPSRWHGLSMSPRRTPTGGGVGTNQYAIRGRAKQPKPKPPAVGLLDDLIKARAEERNQRLWEAYQHGELIFEDKLTSEAFWLGNYHAGLKGTMAPPPVVGAIRWNHLGPDQQIAYVRGYADARAGCGLMPTDPIELAGWERGHYVTNLLGRFKANTVSHKETFLVTSIDSPDGCLVVDHVEPIRAGHYDSFYGKAVEGRVWQNESARPVQKGRRFWISADSFLPCPSSVDAA